MWRRAEQLCQPVTKPRNRKRARPVAATSRRSTHRMEVEMKNFVAVTALAAFAALAAPALVDAQGTTQTITTVDVKSLATGYRSSKVVGSDVVNEKHETIGKVDDLLISRDQHLYAVISVGGFLGI